MRDAGGRAVVPATWHEHGDARSHVHADADQPHAHDDEEIVAYELDAVRLRTFGLDIGSATTQIIFSEIVLARLPGSLSSTFTVVDRLTRYRSPVRLTPFDEDGRINQWALGAIISEAFGEADLTPMQVDTGAVIVTGEAAGRANAGIVAQAAASIAGDFVCVTAGHHLEAVLAAHGSGAVDASRRDHSRVLNIDIGGGTAKFSAIVDGAIEATAALHTGGRLAAFEGGRIVRLERMGAQIAAALGIHWELDAPVQLADIRSVAAAMADAVISAASGEPLALESDGLTLWLTEALAQATYDEIRFSGGVAEYIDGDAPSDVDDLGMYFARELRARFVRLPGYVRPSAQRIRSTVIGAAQYTVQLSGNTVFLSDPGILPLRNVQTVRVVMPESAADIGADVERQLASGIAGIAEDTPTLGVMIVWSGMPTYARLAALVEALARGVRDRVSDGEAICIAFDADIARIAGRMLARVPGFEHVPIVSVDGLELAAYDYLDVGRLDPTGTVPVTVKSLLFAC